METSPRTHFDLVGTAALAGCVAGWGAIPIFLRLLSDDVDAWVANGVRYPLAAMLYWPVLVWALRRGAVTRSLLRRAAIPACFSFGGQVLWALAPYHVPATLMGLMVRASMVFAVAGAVILFPEERSLFTSKRFYAGLALALGGFLYLSLSRQVEGLTLTVPGLLIMVGCALFFGCYGVTARYTLRTVNPIVAFSVVCQPIAAGTFTLMLLRGDLSVFERLGADSWSLLAISSIIGIGISHVLFYTAMNRLGSSIASCANITSPVFTALGAWWLLHEQLSASQALAGGVLLVGGLLILLAQQKVRRRRLELEHLARVSAGARAGGLA